MEARNLSKIALISLVGILISTCTAMARDYGPHAGYVSDSAQVEMERDSSVHDVVVFTPPAPMSPPLQEQLFDEKLTFEFVDRYYQKFGYTEQQRAYLAPNSHTYYNDLMSYRGTAEEQDGAKRRYAEYMFRRLGEHHFDRIFRKNKTFKGVYETKQAVTTTSATVSKKVKLGGKYNISSNTANISVKNPWLDTRMTIEMEGAQEMIVSIGRAVTKTVSAEAHFKRVDGIITLVGSKAFTPRLGTTFTFSTFTNRTGPSTRESLYLTGLSWVY